ncbi:unnamed protein product [Protopolystoma xenopodis]|uniref:Uncharacterized protein n=1 Tax=Protopolystoma xenopodis TaxID=117903 RepID=A0A3S5CVP8_9PLAT|nr:unnamed protein product [Protopolystoma xenopodis]
MGTLVHSGDAMAAGEFAFTRDKGTRSQTEVDDRQERRSHLLAVSQQKRLENISRQYAQQRAFQAELEANEVRILATFQFQFYQN